MGRYYKASNEFFKLPNTNATTKTKEIYIKLTDEQCDLLVRACEFYLEELFEDIHNAGAQEVPELLTNKYDKYQELVSGLMCASRTEEQNKNEIIQPFWT
jgi:hypothetical protein